LSVNTYELDIALTFQVKKAKFFAPEDKIFSSNIHYPNVQSFNGHSIGFLA